MHGLIHRSDASKPRSNLYPLLLAAGLLGLLSLIIGDLRIWPSGEARTVAAPAGSGLQSLTTGTEMDGFGSWSPDGKRIVFMRSGRLWLMAPDGTGLKQLTRQDQAWDSVSAWHPDGRQLAFVRLSVEEETARVMLLNVATGATKELASAPMPIGHVAWAPSGNALYYVAGRQIFKTDLAGKRTEVLSLPDSWEMLAGGLAVSPDGKRLVYGAGPQTGRGVQYDLWSLALSGGKGEPERLTQGGGIMPAFDRAGKRLVYRNPRQKTGIYLMELDRHQTSRVVADEPKALYFHPAFSPDGKSLLLSRLVMEGGGGRFVSHIWVHKLASGRD